MAEKDGCSRAVQIFFTIVGILIGAGLGFLGILIFTDSLSWSIVGAVAGAALGGILTWIFFDPDTQGIGY